MAEYLTLGKLLSDKGVINKEIEKIQQSPPTIQLQPQQQVFRINGWENTLIREGFKVVDRVVSYIINKVAKKDNLGGFETLISIMVISGVSAFLIWFGCWLHERFGKRQVEQIEQVKSKTRYIPMVVGRMYRVERVNGYRYVYEIVGNKLCLIRVTRIN